MAEKSENLEAPCSVYMLTCTGKNSGLNIQLPCISCKSRSSSAAIMQSFTTPDSKYVGHQCMSSCPGLAVIVSTVVRTA